MRYLLVILLILSLSNLYGQNPAWIPLPDSNATWCAQRGFLVMGPPDQLHTYNYIQTISGDTLINGLVYHKIYESGIFEWMNLPPTNSGSSYYNNQYVACIRENSNKQVYQIPTGQTSEQLLYDFNLQLGDTIDNILVVSTADSIFDGTNYRQRFKISSADTTLWPYIGYYEHVSLIEGIGSTGGLLWSLGPYFEHGGSLYEFTQNGITYYQDSIGYCNLNLNFSENSIENSITIYPNPFADLLNIDIKFPYYETLIISIYDVSGKLLFDKQLVKEENEFNLSKLESGIYMYKLFGDGMFVDSGKLLKL